MEAEGILENYLRAKKNIVESSDINKSPETFPGAQFETHCFEILIMQPRSSTDGYIIVYRDRTRVIVVKHMLIQTHKDQHDDVEVDGDILHTINCSSCPISIYYLISIARGKSNVNDVKVK